MLTQQTMHASFAKIALALYDVTDIPNIGFPF
jgi:hypothetical protein